MMNRALISLLLLVGSFGRQMEWEQLSPLITRNIPPNIPSNGFGFACGYDRDQNRIILFGSGTWEFDLNNNTFRPLIENITGLAPPSRFSMVYGVNYKRNSLIIATGDSGPELFNDIWEFSFDTNTWTELEPISVKPTVRYGCSGGIDLQGDHFYVSHGFSDRRYDDTWVFNLNTNEWKDVSPPGGIFKALYRPRKRCLVGFASLGEHKFAMHGGCTSREGPCPLDDTWTFDGEKQTWTKHGGESISTRIPHVRNPSLARLSSDTNKLLWFGGVTPNGLFGDLALMDVDGHSWKKIVFPSGHNAPSPRQLPAFCRCEPTSGEGFHILFGGAGEVREDGNDWLNDVWKLSGDEFKLEDFPPDTTPIALWALALAAVGIACIMGLIFNRFRYSLPALFYTRIGPVPTSKVGKFLFWHLSELSLGEVLLIIAFLAVQILWYIAYYIKSPSQSAARAMGRLNLINLGLLLFPVSRTSILLPIFGISFERSLKFHRWLARWTLVVVLLHFFLMISHWGGKVFTTTYFLQQPLWGFIALCTWVIMALLAYEPIRRKAFEWFYFPHHLFIMGYLFAIFHTIEVLYFSLPAILVYLIDQLLRLVHNLRYSFPATLESHPGETLVEIHCKDSFIWREGQYLFLNIPEISRLQWHPFSISSSPAGKKLTCHIKDMGGKTWTHQLKELAGKETSTRVRVDGPYGSLGVKIERYSNVVLIAGGIGITPMISILGEIHFNPSKFQAEKVQLIWSSQTPRDFHKFSSILSQVQSNNLIDLKLFVTRGKEPFEDSPKDLTLLAGRPKIKELLESHSTEDTKKRIAVLVCGPSPLVEEVESILYQLNKKNFKYHLHKEVFAF